MRKGRSGLFARWCPCRFVFEMRRSFLTRVFAVICSSKHERRVEIIDGQVR